MLPHAQYKRYGYKTGTNSVIHPSIKAALAKPSAQGSLFYCLLCWVILAPGIAFAQAEQPNPVTPFWKTRGNSGTNASIHFIGTTDTASLRFRVFNQHSGLIDTTGLTFFGYKAGRMNTGNSNTGIGTLALSDNTSGSNNSSVGVFSLLSNTTGSFNAAVGINSLLSNISGDGNVATGGQSLYFNTSGSNNTASGYNSLVNNTTGSNNTAMGRDALFSNTTGTYNTAIGSNANVGQGNLTNATAIGAFAVVTQSNSLVLGNNVNVAIGNNAPAQKLDVVGTALFRMGNNANVNSLNQLLFSWVGNASGAATYQHAVKSRHNGGADAGNAIDFYLWDHGANANTDIGTKPVMTIEGSGNGRVGIGNIAPAASLDVSGTFKLSDGTQGAGKMLTSDAAGNASWQTYSLPDSLTLKNGNGQNAFTKNQLLFGFDGTSTYRHTIKTRHNGGGFGNNAFDFFVWQPSDGPGGVGSRHVMSIDGTGRVGIGVTLPFNTLDTKGAAAIGTNYAGIETAPANGLIVEGSMGLGVAAPVEKLEVNGNVALTYGGNREIYIPDNAWTNSNGYSLTLRASNSFQPGTFGTPGGNVVLKAGNCNNFAASSGATGGNVIIQSGANTTQTFSGGANGGYIAFLTGGSFSAINERVRITELGRVGINTTNPAYPLDVSGSVGASYSNYGYLASIGAGTISSSSGGAPVSIRASNRIICPEFNATSDARIKKIIGATDNAVDLQTINNINIINYQYIDSIEKGNKNFKKVIAQQLEQVYPQAVNVMTDVIPDIYQVAEIKNGVVALPNNLKQGEKVQLIFNDRKEITEVTAADGKSFKVALADSGQVFVYGRQVNDFRTVDYEALTTLNISATQHLYKLLLQQQETIDALQAEKADLKKAYNNMAEDIAVLKQIIQSKAGN